LDGGGGIDRLLAGVPCDFPGKNQGNFDSTRPVGVGILWVYDGKVAALEQCSSGVQQPDHLNGFIFTLRAIPPAFQSGSGKNAG